MSSVLDFPPTFLLTILFSAGQDAPASAAAKAMADRLDPAALLDGSSGSAADGPGRLAWESEEPGSYMA